MRIDILTLFPEMFRGPFDESILRRAQDKGLVEIKIHNLRGWAEDSYGTVDGRPYGGGVGMIMRVDIVDRALTDLKQKASPSKPHTILLTPQGQIFSQTRAQTLAKQKHLILICGHYEGVDERVREQLVDEEISIGDYILTGGELPAMVIVDTIVRLLPGVLAKPEAVESESFSKLKIENVRQSRRFLRQRRTNLKSENLLEPPQYTRPEVYQDWKVPEILLSGDHGEIEKWRREKALEKTKKRRPDLLGRGRSVN